MTYIVLAAGIGANLHPLTLTHPKSLYKLDNSITLLRHNVKMIRRFDKSAEIVVVVGFMHKTVTKDILSENVKIVHNPFYSVTGSMGSLWFAREYLQRENVAVINGDVIFDSYIMKNVICKPTDIPYVVVDSSLTASGKYYVNVQEDKVCIMSKQLSDYFATYSSVTKLDAVSSRFVLMELEKMVNDGMFEHFYEDVLVQMIFSDNFELYYVDIKGHSWTEVDSVDDLLKAKQIHKSTF